jgi:glutaminyl-tRNA synthetase
MLPALMSDKTTDQPASAPTDFIRDIVAADVAAGKYGGKVVTRFPPEPNGYLHIGHAKSICLNFGLANEQGGVCHLRMDDTNPTTEDLEYVEAIQRDVRWLGFDWADKMFYASDYFEQLFALAQKLIRLGRAYVCECTEDEMGQDRGTVTQPGRECRHRRRTAEENLALFAMMEAGGFPEGAATLRGKIDMASPNMKLRDPPLYRIKRAHHYRRGDKFCLYPLYDYAHCLSDSIEGITHSICTTEFESARDLYDWVIQATEVAWVPHQYEFARLNITYTVMSKRKLLTLVEGGHVRGWDDPRLPTIAGLRRRGCTPEAIRAFCAKIGVSKNLSTVDVALFEHTLREDLDARSPRVMGVLRPLKLTIESLPEGHEEVLDAPYWPADSGRAETRRLPFTREVFIERSDFEESPQKDFRRLAPGRSVRLRHACVVTCTEVVKDAAGQVVELRCTHQPRDAKADGTIHWASATHSIEAEVRLVDRLFVTELSGQGGDFLEELNPASLEIVKARVEPSLATAAWGEHFQLERTGYFVVDPDTKPGQLVLGRTVSLKDTWAKAAAPAKAPEAARQPKVKAQQAAVAQDLSPEAAALQQRLGVGADEARALHAEPVVRALFEQAVAAGAPVKEAAGLCCNDLLGELRARKLEKAPFDGAALAELLALVASGALNARLAKVVLGGLFAGDGSPKEIVARRGLSVVADSGALEAVVRKVLAASPALVAKVKAGNANVIGALFGTAMRESGGRADPQALRALLEKALKE